MLPILVVVIALLIAYIPTSAELSDIDVYSDYYEYSDESWVDIDLRFNLLGDYSGIIEIEFFDANNNSLGIKNINYSFSHSYFNRVNGKVDSYEIISYAVEREINIALLIQLPIYIGIVTIVFAIASWILNYKEYKINGTIFRVYTGWHKYRLYEDDTLKDEGYSNLYGTTMLTTTTVDGHQIFVRVSHFNRISFRYDNNIIMPMK